MLEGSQGRSFFLREALLEHQLIEKVDLVSKATEAIEFLDQKNDYALIVIDLLDTLHQGLELECWLLQHPPDFPVIMIVPSDSKYTHPPFITLSAPLSLQDFTQAARSSLNDSKTDAVGLVENRETYDYS